METPILDRINRIIRINKISKTDLYGTAFEGSGSLILFILIILLILSKNEKAARFYNRRLSVSSGIVQRRGRGITSRYARSDDGSPLEQLSRSWKSCPFLRKKVNPLYHTRRVLCQSPGGVFSVGAPQPPPPGVRMVSSEPGGQFSLHLPGRVRSGFPGSCRRFAPGAPGPPPCAPKGGWVRRSVSRDTRASVSSCSLRRKPLPPGCAPAPPVPSARATSSTRRG